MYQTLDRTLQTDIHTLAKTLLSKKMSLVTAESCTGGLLSAILTSVAGASSWFERGYVTYSDLAKQECLNVNRDQITQFGAVSREVVIAMAEGALHVSRAHISLAITGIAGPTGGTAEKPVGTIWLGCAQLNHKTLAQYYHLEGDRADIRFATLRKSLQLLLTTLIDL